MILQREKWQNNMNKFGNLVHTILEKYWQRQELSDIDLTLCRVIKKGLGEKFRQLGKDVLLNQRGYLQISSRYG